MFLKKKRQMCEDCKNVRIIKHFDRFAWDKEYIATAAYIQELLASGKYEMFTCNHPIDALLDENGCWVDDVIWHSIKCVQCNTLFTCSCDTYHGSGSFRKGE